jgi:hypothetical protein
LARHVRRGEPSLDLGRLSAAAQGAFALIVGAAGGVERAGPALRVAFALSDLAVLAPLASLLRRRGRSLAWLAAWAWCPLAAFEFAGGAHLDSLAILLLVSAATRGAGAAGAARARAALLLALGALVKLLPAILLPFVLRGAARPGRALLAFAAPCALALAGVAALQGGLSGLGRGVSEYALRWESASAVHRFVEAACARAFDFDGGPTDPRRLARAWSCSRGSPFGAAAWRRGAGPAAAAFALLGAFLVLTPTLHPWYVAWIVPWLALFPARSFAFLAAAAPLLYAPLGRFVERGEWVEPFWLWPCVLLPFSRCSPSSALARARPAREALGLATTSCRRSASAARPAQRRDAARLLVHDVARDATTHATVAELGRFLDPATCSW